MRPSFLLCLLRADCSPAGRIVEEHYFVADSTPDPLACTADSDCIVDTVTLEDGCCIGSSAIFPQSWAWHTWISERRMSGARSNVSCPPVPPPSPPRSDDCHAHGPRVAKHANGGRASAEREPGGRSPPNERCVASRCTDACP
jgi:hypothetical protein